MSLLRLPFKVKSPAKINLILKVTGLRKDGYHNIATLFQMIDLCDVMTFYPNKGGGVEVDCSDATIPMEQNLAYRAAMALWKPGLPGVRIKIEKHIPSGAGLGGGSSNAATTLHVLNRLWGRGLTNAALRRKGARLGADVPFFLFGPRAWATGIGDRFTALPAIRKCYVLLVKPRVKINTGEVYGKIDEQLINRLRLVRIPDRLKQHVTFEDTIRMLDNDFERVVSRLYPVTARIKRKLQLLGSEGVLLSGSGSTVFALFRNRSHAERTLQKLPVGQWVCALAPTMNSLKHLEGAGRKK